MSMIEKKAWGTVKHIFHDDSVAVSYLQTNKGGYCSIHRHHHRTNQFTIISGELIVQVCDSNDPSLVRIEHTLRSGDTLSIPPNEWHRFVVKEAGIVVETYFCPDGTAVDINDIDRYTEGGEDYAQLIG